MSRRPKTKPDGDAHVSHFAVDLENDDAAVDLAQRIADCINRELSVFDHKGDLVVVARPKRLN